MSTSNNIRKPLKNKASKSIRDYSLILICVLSVSLILFCAAFRYRSGEIDYFDSDATWHTLLTVECYNETPVSQHLFLPLVSLGGENNKWIRWGSTIPDSEGNYYYTSFSPAGYFFPWLFMKVFRLPAIEKSLYIFNNGLFCVSAIIFVLLLRAVYDNNRNRNTLVTIGVISYIFTPELLHGMGIVYWHQSLMQVTLLIQIYSYYMWAVKKRKEHAVLFYLMALVNPYIEWTGYVANVGFALAEMILYWRESKVKAFKRSIILGVLTILSFCIFCGHYLLRTETHVFFEALKNRFMARNVTTDARLSDVFGGYYKSFLYLWVVFLVLIIWGFIRKGSIRIENGLLLFTAAFPIMENIIMKQHALAYTYDRMKAVFVLVLLVCEAARNVLESKDSKKAAGLITIMVTAAALLNLGSYVKDTTYIWDVEYRQTNSQLAQYVTEKYPNAVYATDTQVRGYMNLLFNRGIYEEKKIESAVEIAQNKKKDSVVFIRKDGYALQPIQIIELPGGKRTEISIDDGQIVEKEVGEFWYAAELSDENWTDGVSNTTNTIIFDRDNTLLIKLLSGNKIRTSEAQYSIINIEYDDKWIYAEVDTEASGCKFPAKLYIE